MVAWLALGVGQARAADAAPGRPEAAVAVLQQACWRCHGPDRQKGHLRLDSRAAMMAGGEGGPAVIVGDVEGSPLVQAVRYASEDLQMPPDKPLPPAQVDALVAWVAAGAPWPGAPASAASGVSATAGAGASAAAPVAGDVGGAPVAHGRAPFIGRVHPLVIHFPIACLLLAALAELMHLVAGVRAARGGAEARVVTGWEKAVAFLVVTGAASAVVAVTTGTFFPADGSSMFARGDDRILAFHEVMGWVSMLLAVSAAGYLLLAPQASRWPLRVLLVLAAVAVGVTGHFGGMMVYGAHFPF
jgi:uncharacterized membrane protein/cytochrome c551/c552